MIILRDHIGEIICEYESGLRFLIQNVSDRFLYCQKENGGSECIAAHHIAGGIEREESRVTSFHDNLALAQALDAAEMAALRRLVPGHYDTLDQQEVARVLEIVDNQRTILESRLVSERRETTAGPALAEQFIEELEGIGSSATRVFFGSEVTCVQKGTSYLLDDLEVTSRQALKSHLSALSVQRSHTAQTFEEKLSSALDRVSGQSRISHEAAVQYR